MTEHETTGAATRTLTFNYNLHGNLLSKTSNVSGDQNASGYTYSVAGKPHRLSRVVYLGGDYEDVQPESGGAYNRVQRIQATPAARQVRRRNASTGVWEAPFFEYVHRDHLSSVDAITNSAGVVQARFSFDPFGGRRAATWSGDLDATGWAALLAWQDSRGSRGFTNHEHLNRTGLVHMNGRVYDPRIGRFVSPDPVIANPAFSQSYNRYAYAFNNPLTYVDPTGYNPFKKIAKSIGGAVGSVFKGVGKALGNAFEKIGGFVKKYAVDIAIMVATWIRPEVGVVLAGARSTQQASARYRSNSRGRTERGGGWRTPGIAGPVFMMAAASKPKQHYSDVPGRPLTTAERAEYAHYFSSAILDSVRIVEGIVPEWLRSDKDGITLKNRVYLRSGVYVPGASADDVWLLGHELRHVWQYAEGMTYRAYIWASRRGDVNNPYEKDADATADKIRSDFCSCNPLAAGC